MSLILDALRKSEAERRRGASPSLYAQLPSPATRLRPAWLPWLPVAAVVLLVVGVAVWYGRESGEPATKDELVEDRKSLVPPSPDEVVKTNPAAAAPPPAIAPAPMASSEAAAPLARAGAAPAAAGAGAGAKPPNVDALVQPAAPAGATPAANAAATRIPYTPPPPEPAPAPVEDAVPPVAILDPSTRGSLPPMKLSMHVYNADPALRFAIIDGQRVGEGGVVGAAVVAAIRRDGVLLDIGGRRVLLPRP